MEYLVHGKSGFGHGKSGLEIWKCSHMSIHANERLNFKKEERCFHEVVLPLSILISH